MVKKIFLLLLSCFSCSLLFAQMYTREQEIKDLMFLIDKYGGSVFLEDECETTIFCDIRADGKGIDYYYRLGLYSGKTITAIGTVPWEDFCMALIVRLPSNPEKELIRIDLRKKLKVRINYLEDVKKKSKVERLGHVYISPVIAALDIDGSKEEYENIMCKLKDAINRLGIYNGCKYPFL